MQYVSSYHSLLLAVAVAVSGCTGTPTNEEKNTPDSPQQTVGTKQQEFVRSRVSHREFDCVQDTTSRYLQAQLPQGQRTALTSYSEKVGATELRNLLEPIANQQEDSLGLTIHYGMDNTGITGVPSMVFGLQVVILHHVGETPAGSMYQGHPVEGGFYRIDGQGLQATDSAAWVDQYQRNYMTWLRIRRSNQSNDFDPFAAGTDVTSYTLRYEGGLEDLIAHNQGIAGVEIHALAEPVKRKGTSTGYVETGWRQIVALVALGQLDRPMLDNAVHHLAFTNRALDLGSPCPSLCDLECVFPDKGMPVHPDCP